VNGKIVIGQGEHTREMPGKVLRRHDEYMSERSLCFVKGKRSVKRGSLHIHKVLDSESEL